MSEDWLEARRRGRGVAAWGEGDDSLPFACCSNTWSIRKPHRIPEEPDDDKGGQGLRGHSDCGTYNAYERTSSYNVRIHT